MTRPPEACHLTSLWLADREICPLPGSRFAADGRLLEGPASRGLSQVARPQ